MRIDFNNSTEWLIALHTRYNSSKITLNGSSEAFTAIYHPTPNRSMLVARFDKKCNTGYIICRRKVNLQPQIEKRH